MGNTEVVMLVGSSVDGKVTVHAGASSKQFGSLLAPAMAAPINALRSWANALVISRKTIELDNPSLLPADNTGILRVIIDRQLQLSTDKKVFNQNANTVVVADEKLANPNKISELEQKGVTVWLFESSSLLKNLKEKLILEDKNHIMVEGGGTFHSILLKERWIDYLEVAYFPFLVGGNNTPTILDGAGITEIQQATKLNLVSSKVIADQMVVNRYQVVYQTGG